MPPSRIAGFARSIAYSIKVSYCNTKGKEEQFIMVAFPPKKKKLGQGVSGRYCDCIIRFLKVRVLLLNYSCLSINRSL